MQRALRRILLHSFRLILVREQANDMPHTMEFMVPRVMKKRGQGAPGRQLTTGTQPLITREAREGTQQGKKGQGSPHALGNAGAPLETPIPVL